MKRRVACQERRDGEPRGVDRRDIAALGQDLLLERAELAGRVIDDVAGLLRGTRGAASRPRLVRSGTTSATIRKKSTSFDAQPMITSLCPWTIRRQVAGCPPARSRSPGRAGRAISLLVTPRRRRPGGPPRARPSAAAQGNRSRLGRTGPRAEVDLCRRRRSPSRGCTPRQSPYS